ncbi:hypothetical protein FKM82_029341 [Ascaphus truei]
MRANQLRDVTGQPPSRPLTARFVRPGKAPLSLSLSAPQLGQTHYVPGLCESIREREAEALGSGANLSMCVCVCVHVSQIHSDTEGSGVAGNALNSASQNATQRTSGWFLSI